MHTGREHTDLSARAVETLPFATEGSICLRCASASSVDCAFDFSRKLTVLTKCVGLQSGTPLSNQVPASMEEWGESVRGRGHPHLP